MGTGKQGGDDCAFVLMLLQMWAALESSMAAKHAYLHSMAHRQAEFYISCQVCQGQNV